MNNENLVLVQKIYKSYKNTPVLEDITITLQKGKIYGFIGENGAGKTTLMKIISGLSIETSGLVENKKKHIGCIIESPALILDMTARQNMKYKMLLNNISNEELIDQLLTKVGLGKHIEKKVKNYSLGMKQRLGIALALINDPELLILDEPINGLDPTGISDMRKLLKSLNIEEGITILISSHILAELYELASDYIFINKGKIVMQITHEQLKSQFSKWLVLETDDAKDTKMALKNILDENNIHIRNKDTIIIQHCENSWEVVTYLCEKGIPVKQIYYQAESLEDYYYKIIHQ